MESTAKRRLALLGSGLLLAATITMLLQVYLVAEAVVDAEPYAVAVGLGVAMPLLLAGAYPLTDAANGYTRAVLVVAESVAGVFAGVGAVALLVAVDPPALLPVGGGAAAAYFGGIVARSLVLGLFAAE